ncbi:MAG: type II toxin-antitoxin system VapB family antitoxin [Candidatus Dormibacteria bacterium]
MTARCTPSCPSQCIFVLDELDLNNQLVAEAMRRCRLSTKPAAVDLALRRLVGKTWFRDGVLKMEGSSSIPLFTATLFRPFCGFIGVDPLPLAQPAGLRWPPPRSSAGEPAHPELGVAPLVGRRGHR